MMHNLDRNCSYIFIYLHILLHRPEFIKAPDLIKKRCFQILT